MPVQLFTGLPGAGKTLGLVQELVRLQTASPERPLFARGINGLKEGVAAELTDEMLEKWWELPPGSILAIDECQDEGLMPKDRGNPAAWVQKITKVRHFGMDFLLTTQHPQNMSAYVRRLVDRHVHHERKWNTTVVKRFVWNRCMDDPEKRGQQKMAEGSIWTFPKELFDYYKSSSLHTMKKKIPFKFWVLILIIVVTLSAFVAIPIVYHRLTDKVSAPAADVGAGSAEKKPDSVVTKAKELVEDMRTSDPAKWMAPRVPGAPWTAPAFDGRQVAAEPRIFCLASEEGHCLCHTEQGTRYQLDLKVCRRLVQDGGIYDPTRAPQEALAGQQQPPVQPQAPPAAVPASALRGAGGYDRAVGTATYTPPEKTAVTDIGG
jgi:hypothetical protein